MDVSETAVLFTLISFGLLIWCVLTFVRFVLRMVGGVAKTTHSTIASIKNTF